MQRKLAAILSADAAGYSRLMSEDELGTVRVLTACREAAAEAIARHGGRVVDMAGDNVLADLLAATHEDGTPLTDAEIRDALITLLIAGHDTTAIALAWALEQIVPRADVVEQIVAELQEVTGGASPKAG